MKFSQKFAWLTAAAVAFAMCGTPLAADEAEDELKSAIVLSFLRYSTWKSPLPPGSPLTVGVLGRSSLLRVLQRQLQGKSVDNRTVHVVALKSAGDPCRCQAIYIATDKRTEVKQALLTARAARALTIGESDKFLENGGGVSLLVIDGHMSFEVSLEALDEGGIDISSRLLRLGQVRKRRPA